MITLVSFTAFLFIPLSKKWPITNWQNDSIGIFSWLDRLLPCTWNGLIFPHLQNYVENTLYTLLGWAGMSLNCFWFGLYTVRDPTVLSSWQIVLSISALIHCPFYSCLDTNEQLIHWAQCDPLSLSACRLVSAISPDISVLKLLNNEHLLCIDLKWVSGSLRPLNAAFLWKEIKI